MSGCLLEDVMTSVWKEKLAGLGCELLFDEPLAPFTTFQVGGPADVLALPGSDEELVSLVERCRSENLPVSVLGGGANTLVRDGGIRGVVIAFARAQRGIEVIEESEDGALLDVAAGEKIPTLVRFAAERGWRGVECLAGVPGTMGGALAMNAGTAEGYIQDAVAGIRWLRFSGGGVEYLKASALEFAYRETRFPEPGVVLGVRLRLERGDSEALREHLRVNAAQRRERQPWGVPCAGSIFRNPPHDRAGRLIDAAGLKGRRVGGAEVSEVHGNFFVNRGGATASDVVALIEEVRAAVRERFGVDLGLELRVVGEDAV